MFRLNYILDDDTQEKSKLVLREMETIDDDCRRHGMLFVKTNDREAARQFGIDNHEMPCLIYFESQIPNFYSGDLTKEDQVLDWLVHQQASDEIEDVSDVVLHQMVSNKSQVAVLFCK